MPNRPKPVVLVILDGYGVAPAGEGNAIASAKTPVMNRLAATYPAITLRASAEEVGLSFGQVGNSEVGHLTIGAGQIFYQNLSRINHAIGDGSFFKNKVLKKACAEVKKNKSKLHLLGLVSEGGVHSHLDHLLALLDLAKKEGVKEVYLHAFLDGRDTLPNVAEDFIAKAEAKMKELGIGQVASLCGRYYAMDRDNHWERTELAYRAIAEGKSENTFSDAAEAIAKSYKNKIYDEQFLPTVITKDGQPVATVSDGDAVIFFNFRAERSRQLTKAFVLPEFDKFERKYLPNLFFATLMEYEKDLPVEVAFPPEAVKETLAKAISDAKLKQLHLAETEKYAHVTFFLNGLQDIKYPGEDQVVIPSPRVPFYNQKPEMSAGEITDRLLKEIKSDKYDFIVVNYANADMVGHTGDIKATIEAVEFVDNCLGRVVDLTLARGGVVVITADHGNAEEKVNLQTGEAVKDHTTNPVPFIVVGKDWEGQTGGAGASIGGDLSLQSPGGLLADVAPTILKIMKLKKPKEMTGEPLI
ncbi:MAG: 2,3-bisphosphoglycerate-independent phosphoglycerate mutase [Patescibacteria group bacterium]|jgi:2,3-bisphosphoglycerate-independent phosphoglycerate mutase